MENNLSWQAAVTKANSSGRPWVLATILSARGSTPRNVGTKMLITENQSYDSVGGGKLEFTIIQKAKSLIKQGISQQTIEYFPLSTKVQQCCGGTVSILLECFAGSKNHIAVFGAGHVGKALITILGQLDAQISWIDSRIQELPTSLPNNTTTFCVSNIEEHVKLLPKNSWVLILTHDHSLDYQILEACLDNKVTQFIGVIGSKTKSLRFKKRLREAAFRLEDIESVRCPVGLETIPGKQPMEVAVSIAAQIIQLQHLQLSSLATQPTLKWKNLQEAFFHQSKFDNSDRNPVFQELPTNT